MTTFKDLDLSNQLYNSIEELGFTHPTPIQEAAFSVVSIWKRHCWNRTDWNGKNICLYVTNLKRFKILKASNPKSLSCSSNA